jgi:hypothetical protein
MKACLDKICADEEISIAHIIREALNEYLSKHHPHFDDIMQGEDDNVIKCSKSVLTNPKGY